MNSSEKILLIELIGLIQFAQSLPLEMIAKQNTEPVYPVTIGEHIVAHALSIVLPHNWESTQLEEYSDSLEALLTQLDTGVDRPEIWNELFTEAAMVKDQLAAIL